MLALTAGTGVAMVRLAAGMRTIEQRPAQRRCPSCGLLFRGRGPCGCSR